MWQPQWNLPTPFSKCTALSIVYAVPSTETTLPYCPSLSTSPLHIDWNFSSIPRRKTSLQDSFTDSCPHPHLPPSEINHFTMVFPKHCAFIFIFHFLSYVYHTIPAPRKIVSHLFVLCNFHIKIIYSWVMWVGRRLLFKTLIQNIKF